MHASYTRDDYREGVKSISKMMSCLQPERSISHARSYC